MVESARGMTPNDCRARAILLLISSYGLRTSEVTNLLLSDIDFSEGILTIRRSKNHLTQRLPFMGDIRSALRHFVKKVRPESKYPHVFLTLKKPYQPIFQGSVYNITRNHINRLNIDSANKGPHSIRHACATHLLEVGTSVPKVASLLGHASSRYVAAYIQHTVDQLRSVANFNLDIL